MQKEEKKKNYMTIFFVFLNIFFYIIYTILGEIVYNMGSLSVVDIIERREYYRILSSAFLHAGIDHIIGNMLFLAIIGDMLEKEIGHFTFGAVYLLSAIGGSFASMLYEWMSGCYYHTVGASGAVCGLLGALFIMVLIHHGNFGVVSLPRMLLCLVYMIGSGLKSEIVNNAAHLGGLLTGILLMCLIHFFKKGQACKV